MVDDSCLELASAIGEEELDDPISESAVSCTDEIDDRWHDFWILGHVFLQFSEVLAEELLKGLVIGDLPHGQRVGLVEQRGEQVERRSFGDLPTAFSESKGVLLAVVSNN